MMLSLRECIQFLEEAALREELEDRVVVERRILQAKLMVVEDELKAFRAEAEKRDKAVEEKFGGMEEAIQRLLEMGAWKEHVRKVEVEEEEKKRTDEKAAIDKEKSELLVKIEELEKKREAMNENPSA